MHAPDSWTLSPALAYYNASQPGRPTPACQKAGRHSSNRRVSQGALAKTRFLGSIRTQGGTRTKGVHSRHVSLFIARPSAGLPQFSICMVQQCSTRSTPMGRSGHAARCRCISTLVRPCISSCRTLVIAARSTSRYLHICCVAISTLAADDQLCSHSASLYLLSENQKFSSLTRHAPPSDRSHK